MQAREAGSQGRGEPWSGDHRRNRGAAATGRAPRRQRGSGPGAVCGRDVSSLRVRGEPGITARRTRVHQRCRDRPFSCKPWGEPAKSGDSGTPAVQGSRSDDSGQLSADTSGPQLTRPGPRVQREGLSRVLASQRVAGQASLLSPQSRAGRAKRWHSPGPVSTADALSDSVSPSLKLEWRPRTPTVLRDPPQGDWRVTPELVPGVQVLHVVRSVLSPSPQTWTRTGGLLHLSPGRP